METRASYVVVGSFVLILMVGLVVFAVWLGGSGLRENADHYLIYFSGNVTGLQEGSQVRYRGILVGTVQDVRIDPVNVERVLVRIAVRPNTPVVSGHRGLAGDPGPGTGGAFILLSGAQGAPKLEKAEGQEFPAIRPRPPACRRSSTPCRSCSTGCPTSPASCRRSSPRTTSGTSPRRWRM